MSVEARQQHPTAALTTKQSTTQTTIMTRNIEDTKQEIRELSNKIEGIKTSMRELKHNNPRSIEGVAELLREASNADNTNAHEVVALCNITRDGVDIDDIVTMSQHINDTDADEHDCEITIPVIDDMNAETFTSVVCAKLNEVQNELHQSLSVKQQEIDNEITANKLLDNQQQ